MWTMNAAATAIAEHPDAALALTPGCGHIVPLLQAPATIVDLVVEVWSDPVAAVARHRAALPEAGQRENPSDSDVGTARPSATNRRILTYWRVPRP
jgi:hypothetical protein